MCLYFGRLESSYIYMFARWRWWNINYCTPLTGCLIKLHRLSPVMSCSLCRPAGRRVSSSSCTHTQNKCNAANANRPPQPTISIWHEKGVVDWNLIETHICICCALRSVVFHRHRRTSVLGCLGFIRPYIAVYLAEEVYLCLPLSPRNTFRPRLAEVHSHPHSPSNLLHAQSHTKPGLSATFPHPFFFFYDVLPI